MLKALFLGVFVAVVLAVKAQKVNDNVVVLDVKGVEKKENSLKNLKIPKLNINDVKGEAMSVLREIKRNDFEKLTNKQKRMLLKKMKKEAKEMKRLGLIQRLKRKMKLKRQEKKEKKALKKMLKRKLLHKFLAIKAHKREHKKRNRKHHKRGKNHNKREKKSDNKQ